MQETEGHVEVPGGRVWYRVAGTGDGTPLLCLHGGPGVPHDVLVPLIEQLGGDRPLVLYDQLGAGRSWATDPALFTLERYVAEVDAVRGALGLDEVHVYGQSWGTMLAIAYALTRPRGVRSYVFSSPVFSVSAYERDAARLRAELPADAQATLAHHERHGWTSCAEYAAAALVYTKRHICRLEPWPECLERAWAGTGPAKDVLWGSRHGRCEGTLKSFEVMDQIASVDVPSMLIAGRFDECTPETTLRCAELLPRAEVAIFEDSSHLPHLEEPGRHRQVLAGFLERVERAAA